MNTYKPLIKVELIFTKRNLFTVMMTVGIPTAFFLLFSSVYDIGGTAEQQREFVKQIMFNMAAMSVIGVGLFTCPFMMLEDKTNQWIQIIRRSPVGLFRYYVVKFLRMIAYYLMGRIACFVVGAYVKDVTMPVKEWVITSATIVLGSLMFLILGMAISLINSEQAISAVSNLLYFGLAIVGGLWVPVKLFPQWMQHIAKATPTYHLMNVVNKYVENKTVSFTSIGMMLAYSALFAIIIAAVRKNQEVK